MTKYARAHDMDSWLRDPRIAARGFAHRWQSSVAAGNGEDAFIELVDQFLRPDSDVLDLGCGHGELTLILAAKCRSIVGIEREPGYLELVRKYCPQLTIEDLLPAPAGVRAQAVSASGALIDDFLIAHSEHAVHVLNAPSPGATSSLGIAEKVGEIAVKEFGL